MLDGDKDRAIKIRVISSRQFKFSPPAVVQWNDFMTIGFYWYFKEGRGGMRKMKSQFKFMILILSHHNHRHWHTSSYLMGLTSNHLLNRVRMCRRGHIVFSCCNCSRKGGAGERSKVEESQRKDFQTQNHSDFSHWNNKNSPWKPAMNPIHDLRDFQAINSATHSFEDKLKL